MNNTSDRSASDAETLRGLVTDISNSRDELGVLIAELDRRRHRLFGFNAQMKKHIVTISFAGAALAVILIRLAVQRAHRRADLMSLAGELGLDANRMAADPELVANEPSIAGKLLGTVASAALASATKTVAVNVVQDMMRAARRGASRPEGHREPQGEWRRYGGSGRGGDGHSTVRDETASVSRR